MPTQLIVSYAMLKALADETPQDFIQIFVPFVAECVRISNDPVVSTPAIQGLLKQHFSLSIPQSAIDKMLDRLRLKGFLRLEGKAYVPVMDSLRQITFGEERSRFLRMHDALVRDLVRYANNDRHQHWSTSQADRALQAFLDEGDLLSFLSPPDDPSSSDTLALGKSERFIVASFVQELYQANSESLSYLETVFKGSMIAQAIYFPDPNPGLKSFESTEIYFDTPFLLWVLDCSGPIRKAPCDELLDMLNATHAKLRCFRHTLGEIRGALEFCANLLKSRRELDAYGPTAETLRYFRSQGIVHSDVLVKIAELENDLLKHGIEVVNTPSYEDETVHQWVISEAGLAATLREHMPYQRAEAVGRDVKSISSIMLLRAGHAAFELSQCRAVFLTTNVSLARTSNQFFREEHGLLRDVIPPSVDDFALTSYLWINMPVQAPQDLPRKRIIADCYAATQPSDTLWQRFLEEVKRLEESGKASSEVCYALRSSEVGKTALMDATLGEERAFTRNTVEEILQQAKAELSEDVRSELEQERQKSQDEYTHRAELQSQLDSALKTISAQEEELRTTLGELHETKLAVDYMQAQAREKLAAQRKALQIQSEGAAHRWRIMISVLIGILLFFFEAVTFAVSIGLQAVARTGLLIFLPVLLALIAGTILQVQWGLDIKKPYEVLNVFEHWLSQRIEHNLLARSGLIDYKDHEGVQEATKQGPSDASSA